MSMVLGECREEILGTEVCESRYCFMAAGGVGRYEGVVRIGRDVYKAVSGECVRTRYKIVSEGQFSAHRSWFCGFGVEATEAGCARKLTPSAA